MSQREGVWVWHTPRGDRRVCNGGAQKGLRAVVLAGALSAGVDECVLTEAAREEGLHSMVICEERGGCG